MSKNFEAHFNLLKRELKTITNNIHLVKLRNHDSISKIVNNIKNISENTFSQLENSKSNYRKYRPNIHLYQKYKKQQNDFIELNNKNNSQTINNCTVTKVNFYLDKNSIINIKNCSYKKANTIDFNSNYNLIQTDSSTRKIKRRIKTERNRENRADKKNSFNIKNIDNILYFKYNNSDLNTLNKTNLNLTNNYFRNDYRYNKNYNSINVTKIKYDYYRRNSIPQKEKKFLNEMCQIYNKYNKTNTMNGKYGYDKIISWINELINKEEKKEGKNKYENFCKELMKENNISDFSRFQLFAKNNINEEKSANYFIKDMKKILFKDIT